MIYKHLNHHYIMQKSVIFIVDTYFSSQIYTDLATHFVQNQFKKLDKDDYFGFISLEEGSEMNEIILEKKGSNMHIKEAFLDQFGRPDTVSHFLRNKQG